MLFSEKEQSIWSPPEKLSPSEWAERHRYLPATVAAEPGKYKNSRTPYLAGIIDCLLDSYIEEIVVVKAAQIGFSTGLQNAIGWIIDQQPAPTLLVMPSQDDARKLVEEQIKPLIESTTKLQNHLTANTDDITKETLRFDNCSIHLGWAGSPQSLARRACRFVVLDEVDKYPKFSGSDADPISLARARARTYLHRKKIVIGSTPTTRDGAVIREYENCGDKRFYYVPCPHCNHFQRLAFGQLRFGEVTKEADKNKRAENIERTQSAFYECEKCKEPIKDSHKAKMLVAGCWLGDGQKIVDGQIIGERPRVKRVGFQISALYSPWVSFSQMAAAFLRAAGDTGRMMEFKNQWLGEVFEEVVTSIKLDDLKAELKDAPAAGIVPPWAGCLITSVDVQSDRFYLITRAWGHAGKSQLINFGCFGSFDEIYQASFTPYKVDEVDEIMQATMMVIDAGFRTPEVYEFARRDQRVIPIKGASSKPRQIISLSTAAKDTGTVLRIVDTEYFKDQFANLRHDKKHLLNNAVTDEYLRHLASEQKVRDRKSNRLVWQPISEGTPNHFFDCEIYQCVGAEIARVVMIPPEDVLRIQRDQAKQQRESQQQQIQHKQDRLIPTRQTSTWLQPSKKWI